MSAFFIKKGTFNHCGRSKAWNSTHHGRYEFQTVFLLRNMNTNMYTDTVIYKYMYKNTCTSSCACTLLGGWLCGVCSAVCCCRGVLVLGILNFEIGNIQGFLSVNL